MDGIGLDHQVFFRAAEERAATVWFTHRRDLGELPAWNCVTWCNFCLSTQQKGNTSLTQVPPDWLHIRYPLNTAHQINLMLTSSYMWSLCVLQQTGFCGGRPHSSSDAVSLMSHEVLLESLTTFDLIWSHNVQNRQQLFLCCHRF